MFKSVISQAPRRTQSLASWTRKPAGGLGSSVWRGAGQSSSDPPSTPRRKHACWPGRYKTLLGCPGAWGHSRIATFVFIFWPLVYRPHLVFCCIGVMSSLMDGASAALPTLRFVHGDPYIDLEMKLVMSICAQVLALHKARWLNLARPTPTTATTANLRECACPPLPLALRAENHTSMSPKASHPWNATLHDFPLFSRRSSTSQHAHGSIGIFPMVSRDWVGGNLWSTCLFDWN